MSNKITAPDPAVLQMLHIIYIYIVQPQIRPHTFKVLMQIREERDNVSH